ncbi:MAG: DUF547 domain-containing protein [Anaerolineaceae bacterium]|nr:DUF547 domain-containing protein [Anaerolineaceae bacterium]
MPENQWTSFRDRALQKMLNIPQNEVLNQDLRQHTIPVRTSNFSSGLQSLLKKMVSVDRITPSGMIDYQAIKEDKLFQFDFVPLTNQLIYFDPQTLSTNEERLAFWLNLYNAMIINAVLEYDIQESVTEGKWGAAAFFQKAAYLVNQQRVSADDIEHGILRANQGHTLMPGKQFAQDDHRHNWVIFPMEPRIHFALHCASVSSPRMAVYQPEKLDAQLNTAVMRLLQKETIIDANEFSITLPDMMKWVERDMGGQKNTMQLLIDALPEKADELRQHFERWKFKYNDHDWALNQKK